MKRSEVKELGRVLRDMSDGRSFSVRLDLFKTAAAWLESGTFEYMCAAPCWGAKREGHSPCVEAEPDLNCGAQTCRLVLPLEVE